MGRNLFRVDNSAVASNPSNVRFRPLVWIRYNSLESFSYLAPFLLFSLLSYKLSWWFLPLAFLYLLNNLNYWIVTKDHFKADSNGGIVISTAPPLVAVWTDLRKSSSHSFPVIKVIKYKPQRTITLGERLPTIANYKRHAGDDDDALPYWADFFPLPAEYATDNRTELEAAMNSYPHEQWQSIEKGVAELPKPYKLGLYRVEVSQSNWQDEEQ